MQEIEGARQGTRRFLHDGHIYHIDVRSIGSTTYRCALRTGLYCRAILRVEHHGENLIELVRPHIHPGNPNAMSELRMKAEIYRLCRETIRPVGEIYHEVSMRYEQDVVMSVTLRSLRVSMDRERARALPPIPESIGELGRLLEDHPLANGIYRGTAMTADRTHAAILFGSREMLEILNNAVELFISCPITVHVGPLGTYKMMVVYVRVMGTAIPAVYILFRVKNKELFIAVWRMLDNLAPAMRARLMNMVSVYESFAITSLREVFRQPRIYGFWFFYIQALCQKWCQLGLVGAPQTVLWMATALPLAPVMRFPEGLNRIAAIGDEVANEYPNILQFLLYMRRQWRPLAPLITVSRVTLSTNEMCEVFQRNMTTRFSGAHRTFWIFIEKLRTTMSSFDAMRENPQPAIQSRSSIREEARIINIQDRLSTGRLNIEEFLMRITDERVRAQIAVTVNSAAVDDGNDGLELITINHIMGDVEAEENAAGAHGEANINIVPAGDEAERPEDNIDDIVPHVLGLPLPDYIANAGEEAAGEEAAGEEAAAAEPNQHLLTIRPCSVCLINKPKLLYMPCRHFCICSDCDAALVVRKCPLCRVDIEMVVRIFYA